MKKHETEKELKAEFPDMKGFSVSNLRKTINKKICI